MAAPGPSDESRILPGREPILLPWIGRVRITANLPKPKYIAVNERYLPNELRPFPRVTLRNNHPHRPAMFLRNRFPIPFMRQDHIVIHAHIHRIIRRIPVVALEEHMT